MATELFDFYQPNIAPQSEQELSSLSSPGSLPQRHSSAWEILNRATLALVQHKLAAAGQSAETIQLAQALLDSYHKVYRADLMQHRSQGNYGSCPIPTPEQLNRIEQNWQANTLGDQSQIDSDQVIDSAQGILRELQRLAQLLKRK